MYHNWAYESTDYYSRDYPNTQHCQDVRQCIATPAYCDPVPFTANCYPPEFEPAVTTLPPVHPQYDPQAAFTPNYGLNFEACLEPQLNSSVISSVFSPPPTPDFNVDTYYSSPESYPYLPTESYGQCPEAFRRPSVSPSISEASSKPSFEPIKSQIIKEGLKITIECKRKSLGLTQIDAKEIKSSSKSKTDPLSLEDQVRRQRRRDRNKIAATKCRIKKKAHACQLSIESDKLVSNIEMLKTERQQLEEERNRLLEILNGHLPVCQMDNHRLPF